MAIILQTSDFTGKYAISTDVSTVTKLQEYIDRHEREYIYRLLGKELGDLFIADVSSYAPVTAKYVVIFNQLNFEDSGDHLYISRGIKEILKAVVFYHYVADEMAEHGQSGVSVPSIDTSSRSTAEGVLRFAEQRFNSILPSVEAIQVYVEQEEPADYPEYEYHKWEPKYSSIV